jgi:creatinine amidohydrolase/Fe(II)-dependent formamide hydrolase-like protein
MARYLQLEGDYHVYVWTWFEAIEAQIIEIFWRRPPLHADEAETAMLMAINASLVHPDQFKASTQGSSPVWGKFIEGTLASQVVKRLLPKWGNRRPNPN